MIEDENDLTRRGSGIRSRASLIALLVLLAAWGGWLIYRTSFLLEDQRVFCLFDDAMISMTYARNLVEGYGLNWARYGEPVEGFTHPLWTAVMVVVNALPLDLRLRSLPIQLLSLSLLMVHVVVLRRLTLRHFSVGRARHWLPAGILTAFFFPLAYWGVMGMETALQALLTTLSVLLALDIIDGRNRHLALWGVGAAAYLLRMDMILMVGVVQLFVLLRGGLRKGERRSWLMGMAFFAAVALGYQAFRWLYFHDVLPNTYYLKLGGIPVAVRLLRGLHWMVEFVRAHLFLLLAVGLGVAPLLRRYRNLALPAGIFVLYCAYSVWVGGDVWEMDLNVRANRFVAFAMPQVFLLLNALVNIASDAWATRRGRPVEEGEGSGLPGVYGAAVVTALAFLTTNGLWFSEKAVENWRNLAGIERPLHVQNHAMILGQLRMMQRNVQPGAVVASFWAGIPAYFSDYRMVDLLGYNDRHIAHSALQVELNENNYQIFLPGHTKWDNEYVMREHRPDAFLQTWALEPHAERQFMRRHGYRKLDNLWVRRDSEKIQWPGTTPPAGVLPGAGVER